MCFDSEDNDDDNNKGRAIPLQAWIGPEGSRSWGSHSSRQSAHEGGKVVIPRL